MFQNGGLFMVWDHAILVISGQTHASVLFCNQDVITIEAGQIQNAGLRRSDSVLLFTVLLKSNNSPNLDKETNPLFARSFGEESLLLSPELQLHMNRTNSPPPLSLTVFSHQGNDSAQKRGAGKWSVSSSGNRTYRLETVSLTRLVQRSGKDWRFSPSISSGRQISRWQTGELDYFRCAGVEGGNPRRIPPLQIKGLVRGTQTNTPTHS